MNILKKLSPILIVVLMLFGMMAATTPSAAAAESVPGCKQWHTVQSGEYLTKIANLYNTTWLALVEINDLEDPNLIFVGQILCVSVANATTPTTPAKDLPNSTSSIRVYATSVKEDQTVTLQGKYLATSTSYTIYMSNFKANQPVNYWVGSVTTDKSGAFKVTYNLPKKMYDVTKIKVTIVNGTNDTASNWFYNITSDGNVGGVGNPTVSFTIVTVKENESVKIQTSNLPANVKFKVYMDKNGTKAEEGILVGTLSDSKGGTVTATFEIPEELWDRSKIDIRIESNTLEMSAYKTFENK
ncbi:MAG TPA: LysM peptidoglycan-binding domain-containing protein [Anaerolineales bacterium]|nr:LysM peptidoglycan-binding domain-containing protein [Anaerolineales bacterium]